MIVVIEGPDLSGKSTMAEHLAEEIGFKYIKWPYEKHILEKCPDESGETFYKTLLQFKDCNMVLDRGFISNFVYCDFLNREYDNSYIHEVIKELKPLIIHLHPSNETLEARMDRGEDFIENDKLYALRDCYLKHVETLKNEHNWDIKTVDVNDDDYDTVKELVFQKGVLDGVRHDIKTEGQSVVVYSNHHSTHLETIEKMFNIFDFDPRYHNSAYDDDYEAILPRVEEVANLLKQYPTHRGAVILNSKAERGDCICLWQLMIRNGRMNSLVYIRSSDLERKLKQDLEMTTWVVKTVAEKVGIQQLGRCKVIQGSAHIYI